MNTDEIEQNPDAAIALTEDASQEIINRINPLVGYIESCYTRARDARRTHEIRWLDAYGNFRGNPINNRPYISTEISKAFIKITKTKTLAAYAQLMEIALVKGMLPIEITPSPEPLGAEEFAHIDPNDPIEQQPEMQQAVAEHSQEPSGSPVGYFGDGQDLEPGATLASRTLAYIKEKFGKMVKIKPGEGDDPNRIMFMPAADAAFWMNKRIHDQLEDMDAITMVKQASLEKCILGTGILKGPFNKMKEYPDWDGQGKYTPKVEEMPILKSVSLWNFYPDPEVTAWSQAEWAIERHKLSRFQLLDLKKLRSFIPEAIDRILNERTPNYVNEDFENILDENATKVTTTRWEVKEFWGKVDTALLEELDVDFGFDIPEDVGFLHLNVWVCAGEIIRCVLNPLTPARLPYYVCPYEFNPYSMFGVGVAENMEDTQELMNGFMRLAVDNAVLSGSIMLEVDESVLAPGQDYKVETGKVFRKTGGAPNQKGVQSITIQNTSTQNMQMFDVARRLADEATGIPSFSHGMTGVQGVGRTSSGISQLINAAALPTKNVLSNQDEYWYKPIGKAMYYWNMQFKFDPKMRGDLSVLAKGASNYVQKEQITQMLIQLGQIAFAIPALAPWINAKEWLKWLAESMNFDPKRLMNRPDEARLQAMIIQMAGGVGGQGSAPAQEQSPGAVPPDPSQPGFTGNTQGMGNVAGQNGQPAQGSPA